ncbi:PH domain-containing protein [Natronosporangium hydrolyticum]|uniref:PH domain-containing protein n=1 Tax=Natronosporangium hydrolyticum TaxID=2811111 RepID=A0A895YJ76_9ACTN|nr:PH domain-containing protein [Natronosporangium hydrolyticum]QSB16045.1 PH domain-containing protein [Natronosporangium hydrolyticum]
MAAAELTLTLLHRLRERAQPPAPPQLTPAVVRREIALVSPPGRTDAWQSGRLAVLVGVGWWFVLAGAAGYAEQLRPDWSAAVVAVTLIASVNMLRVLGAGFGPRVALFPDRLEIRRGLGRYLIPWPAVAALSAPDGRLTVFLAQAGVTSRRGWAPAHSAYGVRIRNPGLPISTLVDTVEEYRRRPADHRFPAHPGR